MMEALNDDYRHLWLGLYKDNDLETVKALRDMSERTTAISNTAKKMLVKIQK